MKDVTYSTHEILKRKFKLKGNASKLYLLLFLVLAVYYYIALPPIHYASIDFWIFFALIVAGILIIELIKDGSKLFEKNESFFGSIKKSSLKYKVLIGIIPLIFLVFLISQVIFSPFFMAKSYSQMITINQADFEADFPQTDINQIPLIDRDTAARLGNRRLGSLTQLVSQFVPSEEYTQININNYPYRVTPLEYAGFFKWLNNFQEGIPNYIKVDNVSGDVTIETPEQAIKYSYSDKFNRYILRHLRLNYPFTIFGKPNFEIDDNGTPYYIASTYTRNFFLFEPEVNGLITVNAMTGQATKYDKDNIPNWIDRVYSSELILHQLQMNGKYLNGYWNTVFSNEGVTQPTEGYNYLPLNDDLYLYTGITSIVSDESNIGFVLVNMRTKEAKMYPLNAAEEFSAMSSAEGSVQEKGYKATFPLLININGRPMYILSLKDSSGLIKSYAIVDVENYQKVYVDVSIEGLLNKYALDYPVNLENLETTEEIEVLKGTIDNIRAVVKEGNTVYYFMLNGQILQVPIQLSEQLPFIENGQEASLEIYSNGQVKSIRFEE